MSTKIKRDLAYDPARATHPALYHASYSQHNPVLMKQL